MIDNVTQQQRPTAGSERREDEVEVPPVLMEVVEATEAARDDAMRRDLQRSIGELVAEVRDQRIRISKDLIDEISQRIADIDEVITKQVNEILHDEDFQKLEASWRGLHFLVHESVTGPSLKIKMMSVGKDELIDDFKEMKEFDKSNLWVKIYEEEYGVQGGAPFAAIIGDYEFDHGQQDMFLLKEMSRVAASAHAPFIASASPGMFGKKRFAQLGEVRDLATNMDDPENKQYTNWNAFRESEEARFVALTLPHVLARLPYGGEANPTRAFNFDEEVDGREDDKFLWTSAAYALGTRLTDAFHQYGWCAAIRGVQGGGLVEDLPHHTFETDAGETVQKCPTKIMIPQRREGEFVKLGFVPLVHIKNTKDAVFNHTPTAQKPPKFLDDLANANAKLSSQLQFILAASRFAHYLKAICSDKIGAFAERKNVEDYLNTWIAKYVLDDDDAPQDKKAEKPLRHARVDVFEVPGSPGEYRATVLLRPHFQLDGLTLSLRLVASLPKSQEAS